MKLPAVYIMASKPRGTLYTGVASNLVQRVYQHKNEITGGFSQRYGCKILVYFQVGGSMKERSGGKSKLKLVREKIKLILLSP